MSEGYQPVFIKHAPKDNSNPRMPPPPMSAEREMGTNGTLDAQIIKAALKRRVTLDERIINPELIRIKKEVSKWLETSLDCKPLAVKLSSGFSRSEADRLYRSLYCIFDHILVTFELGNEDTFVFTLE